MLEGKRRTQRDRRVTAERYLGFRREIAYPPACPGRGGESRLRESNLRGDPLHLPVARKLIVDQHAGWIATGVSIGERSNFQNIHFLLSLANSLLGVLFIGACPELVQRHRGCSGA